MKVSVLIYTLLIVICAGCLTSARRLQNIHLDMTKAEVKQVLGEPSSARGSIRNKFGQVIEVWEYPLDRPGLSDGLYWLYFYDNKLVQWGEAGDWKKEADRIYEYRFGSAGGVSMPP
jgi:hypothetical protein